MLKIIDSGNILSPIRRCTRPATKQIVMQTKENIAEVFFGRMKPRKDGNVLYSIPKIINIGKSSHN